ncbi:MAG: sodium:proline symporter, partial [Salibacteraceae bacterium]|nr:sodium:proline symporter [Salibacteraceae bacterium]
MNDLFAMLATIDWIIIVSFLLLSLGIGLYYRQNAGKSISDFFLGGRNLPWYIAGISMVATTFAADTPLAVSELVSQGGIAKNWLWWSFIFGGALTTMFFATLWRRAGVLTELEFITLRYEGKPAHYLRLFKSVYLGLFINAIIIAWVNLAMMTLIEIFFDVSTTEAMFVTFGLM